MPRTVRCPVRLAAVAAAAVACLVITTGPAAAQTTSDGAVGTVVIVHGLEGVPADVYLDGASTPALSGFDFRRITDPLALPVGRHQADIRRAGDPPTATPLMSGVFFVVAGQRVTIAALLDPAGQPSWLVFPNDTWTTDAGSSALRLRHLAASGPVILVVDGRPSGATFTNLAVGSQVAPVALAPGRHTVRIDDAASGSTLVADQAVTLAPGLITTLYLTGRSASGLGLITESPTAGSATAEISALQTTPGFIATGDSGLAAPREPSSPLPLEAVAFAVAALAAAVAGFGWRGLRRRARPAR